jgi:hypothetical protein
MTVPKVVAYLSVLMAAGCGSRSDINVGQGYTLVLKDSQPLLHQSGTEELFHLENRRNRLVAEYVIFGPAVINDIAVLNCGLSDDRHWKTYPALIAYRQPGPPCEITESVIRLYCTRTGRSYMKIAGAYCF